MYLLVQEIEEVPRGATLTGVSGRRLLVDDAGDFSPEGGMLLVGGAVVPYSGVVLDDDDLPGVLSGEEVVLAADPPAGLEAGLEVRIWDPVTEQPVITYLASGTDDEGAPMGLVTVSPERMLVLGLAGRVSSEVLAGLRDALVGRVVSVEPDEEDSEEWVVTAVHGQPAQVDGGALTPGTLDGNTAFIPGTEPESGPVEPPEDSPEITVTGTSESLHVVTATALDQTSVLEVEISTDYDPANPGAATWQAYPPTRSNRVVLSALPDGADLAVETSYAVRVWEANALGRASAPSSVVTAALDPSKVAALIADRVEAGGVLTGILDVGGVVIIDGTTGTVTIHHSDGGTSVLGDVIELQAYLRAEGLTVVGDASFYSLAQVFGDFAFAAGISPPTDTVRLSRTWQSVTRGGLTAGEELAAGEYKIDFRGLVLSPDGGQWASSGWFFAGFIRRVGAPADSWEGDISLGGWNPLGGITRIANTYYVLGQPSGSSDWQIRRFSATDWSEIGSGSVLADFDPPADPAIGTDGTDLLITHSYRNGNGFTVERRTTGGGLIEATACTHSLGRVLPAAYVGIGTFDYGATRIIVAPRDRNPLVYTTAGARDTSREWARAGGEQVRGMWWDGTRFRHLDRSGRIWTYAAGHPLTTSVVARAEYRSSDSSAYKSGHGTPSAPFTWPARSWLQLDAPAAPDAGVTDPERTARANQVAVHIGPDATSTRIQVLLGVGVIGATLQALDTASALSTAANTFPPGSSVGQAYSVGGGDRTWRMRGDGDLWLPGLDQWHTLTLSGGYSAGGTAPQYRVDPTGRVELRGIVTTGSAANDAVAFTLPVGARPQTNLEIALVTYPVTSTTGHARIFPSGEVRLRAGMGTPTTYRLDGATYSTL